MKNSSSKLTNVYTLNFYYCEQVLQIIFIEQNQEQEEARKILRLKLIFIRKENKLYTFLF
jgi:hypothetical protein